MSNLIEVYIQRLRRKVDHGGSYPVRRTLMYLDEIVDDGVRAARVLGDTKQVSIAS